MHLGMPTLVECDGLEACCKLAEACDIDFVEINMSFPQYLPSALSAEEVVALGKRYGLFFTIHADEALNPFDFNEKVSTCYFDVMRDTIRFAISIGAPVINIHLQKGIYVTLPEKVVLLTDVYGEQYQKRVDEFIVMCEGEIGDTPLKIAIENVDSNPFTESQRVALKRFMESPVFALTLDTGHEFCLDFKDSDVFAKYPERLLHIHLHDAVGRRCHLPLGTGEVDIRKCLSRLKGDTCLIEVKTGTGLKESVKYLKSL